MKATVQVVIPPPATDRFILTLDMDKAEAQKLFRILGEELNRNKAISGALSAATDEAGRDALAVSIRNALYAKGVS